MSRLARALESETIVYAACAASLALGLFFIFVWAPHPWGWRGFDHYHDLALEVTSGKPFSTMDVPWAYTYFLAAFYRLFGVHPRIPLVAQAGLNALNPLLVFQLARAWIDRRTAAAAAVLTGLFSFNTVYASTESSDAVCTVVFLAAIALFVRALQRRSYASFCAAGLLAGAAPQFRPNLILLPLLLAAFRVAGERSRRALVEGAAVVACAMAILAPWIVRNYRLTSTVLPTSVHGGVQLWYGTLQVGPYLRSRAYNPRSVFEASAFPYTSLDDVPIVVDADFNCTEVALRRVELVHWSDANRDQQRVAPLHVDGKHFTFEISPPRADAVLYYYLAATWSEPSGPAVRTTPAGGGHDPAVYFVSQDHLGDLDIHGDLLDVFDFVRLVRRSAWHEPVPFDAELRAAAIAEPQHAAAALLRPALASGADKALIRFDADDAAARAVFADGSSILVPKVWRGRITDLTITQGMASTLMTSPRSMRGLEAAQRAPVGLERCEQSVEVRVNDVFYRREPHMMRRYSALAFDNIRREPGAFLLASAYRAVRLFVIEGASDTFTAQQFTRSAWIYAAGTGASVALLLSCIAGIVISWMRGDRIGLPLLLILYVPATLAPVLINMRYTVTIQPLMFVFTAVTLITVMGLGGHSRHAVTQPSAR
jgi:hypothetical protein